jgi:hypothetical protein
VALELKYVPSSRWALQPFLGKQIVVIDEQDRMGLWNGAAYVLSGGAGSFDIASQGEAEAGTDNTKGMTPLRTKQQIDYQRGAALGLATLGADAKVPTSQLPESLGGGLAYQGVWNATTNTPTIPTAVGNNGEYYKVSVSGSTNINGISTWAVGDWIISNGTTWDRIANSESVSSVAGKTGAVSLVKADVGLSNADNTSDANKPVSTPQQTALNLKADLANPALTGTPTAPTAALGTNTTQIATMQAVQAEIAAAGISGGLSGYWYDRPRAEDVPVGTIYMATDWNNSLWASDGYAHWKPFGGKQIVYVGTPKNLYGRGTAFSAYVTETEERAYASGMILDDYEVEVVIRHRAFWTRKPSTQTFRFYDAYDFSAPDDPALTIALGTAPGGMSVTVAGTVTMDNPTRIVDTLRLKGVGPGAILPQVEFARLTYANTHYASPVAATTQVYSGNTQDRARPFGAGVNFRHRQVIDNSGNYATALELAQRIIDSVVITVSQG